MQMGWKTPIWNYLRVRGEYGLYRHNISAHVELPPRARRILAVFIGGAPHLGTTSACAENTDGGFRVFGV